MASVYKQKFVVVMENGRIIRVTVYGEDSKHGEGLAIDKAIDKNGGGQVWDIASVPVATEDQKGPIGWF